MSSWAPSVSFFLSQHHSYNAGMGCPFLFADCLSLNVHRRSHIGVSQQFLLYLQVHPELSKRGAVGVPKGMHPTPVPSPAPCWPALYGPPIPRLIEVEVRRPCGACEHP